MKVVWTDEARAHLAGIHDFIKRDAPFYATQTQMSGSKHRCRGQNTDVGVTQMSGSDTVLNCNPAHSEICIKRFA